MVEERRKKMENVVVVVAGIKEKWKRRKIKRRMKMKGGWGENG